MNMREKEAKKRFEEIKNTLLIGTMDIQQVADTIGCSYITAQKWLDRAVEQGFVQVKLKRTGHLLKSEYSLTDPEKTRRELEMKP